MKLGLLAVQRYTRDNFLLLSNHIRSTLRAKDKHLSQGKTEDGTGAHSFSPSTSAASYVHSNYRLPLPESLPPLLCRVNGAA